MLATLALASCAAPAPPRQVEPARRRPPAATAIALDEARAVFAEAAALCAADRGALWGRSLCAPLMIADPQTRFAVASQADGRGILRASAGVFTGALPAEQQIANTAMTWAGVGWVQLVWPLPADHAERAVLVIHELFHGTVGRALAGAPAGGDNAHLDRLEGRFYLQLEWRALGAALRATDDAERRSAVGDALALRGARRAQFPGAAASEDALELNEGLAEYTGVVVALAGPDERIRAALRDLEAGVDAPSFVRSFAYATGPAYGLLLDRYAPAWRGEIAQTRSLGDTLARSLALALPDATLAAARHGGEELRRREQAREAEREARRVAYRSLLVDSHVVRLSLRHSRIAFDPRAVLPLDDLGSVYPALRVVDDWGILEVSGGALLAADWSSVVVPAPGDATLRAGPVTGPGWSLALAAGWRLVPAERAGDLRLGGAPQ